MVMALCLSTVPRHRPLAAKALHFLFLLAVTLCSARAAGAATLMLAWDASPDPSVRGYRIYVGTSPGVYSESFDVVGTTAFIYTHAVEGTPYYFAVAAFDANHLVGLPSAEILGMAAREVSVASRSVPGTPAPQSDGGVSSGGVICARENAQCYSTRVLAQGRGTIGALAPTQDGRLFFIEDGQRIQLVGPRASSDTVLAVDPTATLLTGLALDAAFESNGRLLVGEMDRRATGSADEMSIVRYRVVNDTLGQRMWVASVLAGRPTGVPFTTDAAGRLYVAVPATSGDARIIAPAGAVLRFAEDGTVSSDSWRGSPLFASSVAFPGALSWDRVGQKLWVSGLDAGATAAVATIDAGTAPVVALRSASRLPLRIAVNGSSGALVAVSGNTATGSTAVWLVAPDRAVYTTSMSSEQTAFQLSQIPIAISGDVVALAIGQRGEGYLAVQSADGAGSSSFSIVALIPKD